MTLKDYLMSHPYQESDIVDYIIDSDDNILYDANHVFALEWACQRGFTQMYQACVMRFAAVNVKPTYKCLCKAVAGNHKSIVRFILKGKYFKLTNYDSVRLLKNAVENDFVAVAKMLSDQCEFEQNNEQDKREQETSSQPTATVSNCIVHVHVQQQSTCISPMKTLKSKLNEQDKREQETSSQPTATVSNCIVHVHVPLNTTTTTIHLHNEKPQK